MTKIFIQENAACIGGKRATASIPSNGGVSSGCRRSDRPRHWLHRHLLAGTWHSAYSEQADSMFADLSATMEWSMDHKVPNKHQLAFANDELFAQLIFEGSINTP